MIGSGFFFLVYVSSRNVFFFSVFEVYLGMGLADMIRRLWILFEMNIFR